jgi:hypothetical protein
VTSHRVTHFGTAPDFQPPKDCFNIIIIADDQRHNNRQQKQKQQHEPTTDKAIGKVQRSNNTVAKQPDDIILYLIHSIVTFINQRETGSTTANSNKCRFHCRRHLFS